MTNRPPSVAPLTDSPLQQYYFRALICFAAAGTLASYMEWSELSALSPLYLGAMAFLLLYTYVTYHFTHKLPPERLKIVSRWLSSTDAALIGMVLCLTDVSLLPLALFLTEIGRATVRGGGALERATWERRGGAGA